MSSSTQHQAAAVLHRIQHHLSVVYLECYHDASPPDLVSIAKSRQYSGRSEKKGWQWRESHSMHSW